MKDETIDVPFTKSLNDFLVEAGYTHIYSLGADDTESKTGTDEKVVYWVQPLKDLMTKK